MDYITRKCACCGFEITVEHDNILGVIQYDKRYYHKGCFIDVVNSKLTSKRTNKTKWQTVLGNIDSIENETTNALNKIVYEDKLAKHLLDNYEITEVPVRLWQMIAEVGNGKYKGKRCKPVPVSLLFEAWQWAQINLNEIDRRNKVNKTGPTNDSDRLRYDLAIVLNKLPIYLKKKEHNIRVSNEIKKDIEDTCQSKINYCNINNKANNNCGIDITEVLDDIF